MAIASQTAKLMKAALLFAAWHCGGWQGRAQAPPTPSQPPITAREGAVLFSKSGCTFCHGSQGNGTEKAPSLRDVRRRKTDEEIYRQIHDGGKMMPPFGEALSDEEIHALAAFLRAKDGWELLPREPEK